MVNAGKAPALFTWLVLPVLALLLFTATAWLRGAEYDEQYTLFLTAGTARPMWPDGVFAAVTVAQAQTGHASLPGIAHDLRATDVHPPLYFWAVSGWRRLFGPSLFAARMLSVLCATASLLLIGLVARARQVPPGPAMLVALGCYGLVYTGGIARGFALAEVLLLAGTLLTLQARWRLAGLLFGAATAANYLAVFVPLAIGGLQLASLLRNAKDTRRGTAAVASREKGDQGGRDPAGIRPLLAAAMMAIPFLALDGYFFISQHDARPDQFPPFALGPALLRLLTYQSAAVFGGLPTYVNGADRIAVAAVIVVVGLLALITAKPWRDSLLVAGALATPAGLLLLGAIFHSTPIELRYLSFSLPFVALLVARHGFSRPLRLMLAVQAAGILGLLAAPHTMQPARMTARAAAMVARGDIVLLPAGNDGVGTVGAFGIEAPPDLSLLLVHPSDTASTLLARINAPRRLILALLAQDHDSAAGVRVLHTVFTTPNWRCAAAGTNVEVCERVEGRVADVFRGVHVN